MAERSELLELLGMVRRDAPQASLLAIVDRLEAFTRDNPDDLVSQGVAIVGRSIATAASTELDDDWARVALNVRLLRTITASRLKTGQSPD
ncbi:hypothetical protein BH09ACT6_BH09ACT6_18690 [soil metagenome]